VVIIGAGIIGCAVAHRLARRGARVRLFDARAVGAGATHASAGVLAPYIESPREGPLLEFAVRSLSEYGGFVADVAQDSGMDVEYRISGTLEVGVDAEAATRLRAAVRGTAQWLDTASTLRREPSLAASIQGAVLIEEHGYVAAPRLLEALTWAAVRHGAEIETGRRIVAVEKDGHNLSVRAEDGATWPAQHVVLAAGSWASQAGLPEPAAHAVRPIRGQLLRLTWPAALLQHVIWGPDCYVVPWKDGTVLVGATVEDVGFDERTTAAGVRDLLDAVCELLPAAWGATFREARAGLRPATTDGLPIIGPSAGTPGVTYATGHYRNGVLLAPITAALVADWILDGRLDPALGPFQPSRFMHLSA
jgi:glycine oxidase